MKRRMSAWGASFGGGRSSDSSAMASGPPDVMANQEAAEATEECSGKKKSKFQTFKKFFARKKRKEPSASGADAALKGSQSTDNISKTSENNTLTQSEKEKGSGSKISLGSKALSHDSVFVSDSSEANEALGASQDSIHGKVKSLQLQLKQAIRLGSPPSLMCVKRTEDMGTMSEDDGLPCSPPEYTAHTALAQVQGNSSNSLEGTDSDEDQLSCAASSRAVSPLVVVPGDFSQPASPFACLDNSAAKHKMGLRHKACNKRKPASRLELKAEEDSVVEDILNSSISEAVEENNEQKIRDASADECKPEKEEEEEQDQAEHSRQSLLSDKTEKEESSSEPEAEQDVSDGPDTSCPPDMGLSEEEATDARPLASSETGSRASSVDLTRGTPEPPAGQIEYLMDPPGTTYGTEEKRDQSDSVLGLTGGEDGEQETEEEESSLLQEVLSSLKTPLNSPLVETESIVLEMEQEEVKNGEKEKEDEEEEEKKAETEEGEEVKEEEEDGEEPILYQAVISGSSISDQNTKEEEEEVTTTTASYNDAKEEMKHVEEEEEDDSAEEEEEDEEEELVVEHFSQNDQVEEVEKEDVVKIEAEEENSLPATQTDNQMQEEGEEKKTEEEKEEEEEAKELEQEPETKGEKLEKTVEDNKVDGVEEEGKNEEAEESEEANEDEKDVQEKMFSETDGGEMVVGLEETVDDFNAINKDETEYEKDGDKILPGQEEEVFDMVHESQKAFDQMEPKEQNLDQEKDTGATEPNMEEDGSEQDEEQESIEAFPQETKQEEVQSDVDTTISSRPSSLTLPETPTTPSKTSTIHINLVSPSAENFASCFQLPPSTVEAKESLSTAEEPGDKVEKAAAEEEEEEAKQPCDAATAIDKEATLSSPIDETSKVRFTITPAWQRSLSIGEKDSSTLPSSPPAFVSSSPATGGMEVVTMEERLEKAELASSAKAEVVLSPSRAKTAEMTTTNPQWNTSPPPESSAVVEGNPNNPFGVRLRKTSALHRFSSEEENAEPVHESAPQPSSCAADSPQPLSVKPSVSQPISNKPALPKKPEVMGDGGGKTKWILDPTAARGGSDPPSWISVAKQKQKVYKENSADNTAVQKEEQERRSSLPMNSSSSKTPESSSKVSPLELNKSSASAEKESRRSLSPPTPVPPQPTKSLSLPFPVPPKPHVTTSITPKPSPQRSLSPPTPVPVAHRPPSCTSPPSTSKPPPSLPRGNMTLTSPPFSSSRTTPAQSAGSSPTPAAQRGVPSPALTQDEPPWMALAKKKAKAWSEMPQIVQ